MPHSRVHQSILRAAIQVCGVVLLAIILAPRQSALAQTVGGRIEGVVVDRGTAQPVPGASITLVGGGSAVSSDRNGRFVVPVAGGGPQSVRIEAPGYLRLERANVPVGGPQPVRFELDPTASPVLVDRVQAQQVLINLMRNAVEAMTDMPIRELVVKTRNDDLGFVRVTVSDTGHGVPPELADELFRAFSSTKASGRGLGLSICRTIIEAKGGRIWTEPRKGGGSHFHFTLVKVETEDGDA